MKHFSLGLAAGAACGFVLALYEDKNGQRLYKPLKRKYRQSVTDTNDLTASVNNLKTAANNLQQQIPETKQVVSDLSGDVQLYQTKIKRDLDKLKQNSASLTSKSVAKS